MGMVGDRESTATDLGPPLHRTHNGHRPVVGVSDSVEEMNSLDSARLFDFPDAVLMTSQHTPVRGSPLHVTRIWVKRDGNWVETLSYQTSIK